MTNFC